MIKKLQKNPFSVLAWRRPSDAPDPPNAIRRVNRQVISKQACLQDIVIVGAAAAAGKLIVRLSNFYLIIINFNF